MGQLHTLIPRAVRHTGNSVQFCWRCKILPSILMLFKIKLTQRGITIMGVYSQAIKYWIRILLVISIVGFFNVFLLKQWILPEFLNCMGRGYYDAFSFMYVLSGGDPDISALKALNINNYDGFLFVAFLGGGIFVSWVAFLTIYKSILLDAPCYILNFCAELAKPKTHSKVA